MKKGFTLIELLVVTAIIITSVTIALPQINKFQQQQDLQTSATQLMTDLRIVQNNATSGVACSKLSASTTWYLLLTNSTQGVSWADGYQTGQNCTDQTVTPPASKVTLLGENIKVNAVDIDGCIDTMAVGTKISFSNIAGDVTFASLSSSCPIYPNTTRKIRIILSSESDPNSQINVTVEKSGNIYLSVPTATPTPGSSASTTITPTP